MKQAKYTPIYILSISLLVLASALFALHYAPKVEGRLRSNPNAYTSASVTSSTVGITFVEVLARNVDRNFAQCINNLSTAVYCLKNSTSTGYATTSAQLVVGSGGAITLDDSDPYLGAVLCRTSTGTSSVICNENL